MHQIQRILLTDHGQDRAPRSEATHAELTSMMHVSSDVPTIYHTQ